MSKQERTSVEWSSDRRLLKVRTQVRHPPTATNSVQVAMWICSERSGNTVHDVIMRYSERENSNDGWLGLRESALVREVNRTMSESPRKGNGEHEKREARLDHRAQCCR